MSERPSAHVGYATGEAEPWRCSFHYLDGKTTVRRFVTFGEMLTELSAFWAREMPEPSEASPGSKAVS